MIIRLIAVLLILPSLSRAEDSDKIQVAAQYLNENRIFSGDRSTLVVDSKIRDQIRAIPDPGTKFGYVVFSLARKSGKLLTKEQASQLYAIIEKRKNQAINWHDARNIIRVHANMELWKYALATDPDQTALAKQRWQKWTDLRLAYMFEEFIAADRFQRAAWNTLTDKQKLLLTSGDWDQHLKKRTGHSRAYSAHKQVRKTLGTPPNKAAFDKISAEWEARWVGILNAYQAASLFQRQREFSMDIADEKFAAAARAAYETEFRKFVTAERDAIRALVQASYVLDDPTLQRNSNYIETLRQDMVKKYQNGSADFLDMMGY